MCEYCGCQQIAVIGELTREHDAVVAIIGQVRVALAGGELARAARHCQEIAAILAPHTTVEELGLLPAMAAEFPDHVESLMTDHRQIEDVLAEAATGPPADPAWPDRLLGVLFLLREHILKEQDGVFPASVTVLETEQWERIEALRARAGTALDGSSTAPTGGEHA